MIPDACRPNQSSLIGDSVSLMNEPYFSFKRKFILLFFCSTLFVLNAKRVMYFFLLLHFNASLIFAAADVVVAVVE